MTDEGVPSGPPEGGPTNRKAGWYRDRQTGRRSFWNGVAWTDLADAVTPLTLEPEPEAAPDPAPLPSPPVAPKRGFDQRAKLIAGSVAAVVVILAIVLGLVLSSTGTAPVSTKGTVPSPASAPGGNALGTSTTTTTSLSGSPSGSTSTSTSTTALSPGETPGATGPATSPSGTSPPPASPPVTSPVVRNPEGNVAIFGDSITVLTEADLFRVFRRYNVSIDAVDRTTMADHLQGIEQLAGAGQRWDWVIELGSNDAYPDPNPNWASDFANEVAAVQTQPCVVFLTVNPRLGPVARGLNTAIASAVASHRNFHSVDWGDIEFRKSGWLRSDGIHPTPLGALELAKLDHQAIRGCQGR
jgi:hypothetical protein